MQDFYRGTATGRALRMVGDQPSLDPAVGFEAKLTPDEILVRAVRFADFATAAIDNGHIAVTLAIGTGDP